MYGDDNNMNCEFPPELSDSQLLTYLDGEDDNDLKSHLKGCPYCRDRARRLANLQNRLVSRLYRLTCPSSMELGDYHLRMLPANQALVVAQHLRECPHCAREVSQLGSYLSDLTSETNLPGKVNAIIAQLIHGGSSAQDSGVSDPAFASLRGGDDEPFIYQADHVQIAIEVQEDVEQPGRRILLGLITGLKSNGFMMEAYQEEKIVATTFVDEIGNFIFSHFSPETYELILLGPDTEIRIQSFIV